MNKNLFRAKPKSEYYSFSKIWPNNCEDGFVFGSLITVDDKCYICVSGHCSLNSYINNGYTSMIEVVPESVGQFTGLTFGEKMIYEDDIIDTKYAIRSSINFNARVVFEQGAFGLEWFFNNRRHFAAFSSFVNYEFEKVGNIHDNPELLKVGE